MPSMAYKIVAEKDDETVRTERTSLLIAVAKACVWSSEGWNVVVKVEQTADGLSISVSPFQF